MFVGVVVGDGGSAHSSQQVDRNQRRFSFVGLLRCTQRYTHDSITCWDLVLSVWPTRGARMVVVVVGESPCGLY